MSNAARTYARALLDAAGSDASRIADELDQFVAIEGDAPAEWAALLAPGISHADRKAVLDTFLKDAHQLVRNVLKVLVDHGRLDAAPEMAAEFRILVQELERQLDVHVTTAIELDDSLKAKLEERLSTSTGKQVRLHASVDPEIIGGLVVRHGDTLIDTSLRGRLDQLRLELSRPAPRPGAASTTSDS